METFIVCTADETIRFYFKVKNEERCHIIFTFGVQIIAFIPYLKPPHRSFFPTQSFGKKEH